jgi:hypothetical protein
MDGEGLASSRHAHGVALRRFCFFVGLHTRMPVRARWFFFLVITEMNWFGV